MPRLALLGAFPFPAPLGSQRYFGAQAGALCDAGAEVTVCCYAAGEGESDPRVPVVRIAARASPRSVKSGPALAKPLADVALVRAFLNAAQERAFDAVLAHNVEAALVALAARARGGPPVVYVAHTRMENELDAWLPRPLAGPARRAGGWLDRFVAARADAVLTLCAETARVLGRIARGPVAHVAPGHTPEPPPDPADVEAVCREVGVAPDGFALYTGNLDRYQALDVLAAAARLAPEVPVLVATHAAPRRLPRGLRCVALRPEAARRLTAAAAVTCVTRSRRGGFPIKLLEYMAAGRAILSREDVCDSLEHERSAWLVPHGSGPSAFAAGLRSLFAAPYLRRQLGARARETLATHHAWPVLVPRILALVDAARAASQRTPPNRRRAA